MRAIVIPGPWKAVTEERDIPAPGEGEALLKMICGGICGSDLASYRGMSAYVSYPRTIGHEFAAQVVQVGPNEYGIREGMVVTGNPYFNCGTCYSCRRGLVNCCVHNETMGVQREGAFSDYFTMPVSRLYDGQGIDPRELALIEPFCISYHGVSRAAVQPGDKVLVLGAGGAAKAVCLKLAQAGAEVVVCNRTADKAAALCAHEPARLRPAGFDPDTLRREAAECGLLVNCTSLGMEGAAGQFEEFSFLDALPAGAPVVDLIYAPAETELLRRAREGGHQTANGFGLLVNQAVLSLEHFTGTAIDAAEMKRRLADVLLP